LLEHLTFPLQEIPGSRASPVLRRGNRVMLICDCAKRPLRNNIQRVMN
jgi:hypothetical protein